MRGLELQNISPRGYLFQAVPSFGDNLKKWMDRRGINGVKLAESLEVQGPTVSQWLNEPVSPRADTLIKLSKVLRCTVDDLLIGVDVDYDELRRELSCQTKEEESDPERGSDVPASPVEVSRIEAQYRELADATAAIASDLFDLASKHGADTKGEPVGGIKPGARDGARKVSG